LRHAPHVGGRRPVARLVDRARAAAERLGIPAATGDYWTLLADASIDAIHNCTPNDLHHQVTAAALEAGKHVLAEKPLAIDATQSADLVARAERAGTVTGVCFNYRHYPLVAEARAMLADGRAGRPHLIRGAYLQDWLLDPADWNWRLQSERSGASRAIGDIGSHWMDLIQHVTGGRIVRVYARLGRLHEERLRPAGRSQTFDRGGGADAERVAVDTEDFATVLFELDGGCPGVFTVSQVTPGARNAVRFEIDAGPVSLAWDQEHPNALRIGRRDRPNEVLVRDPALLSPAAAALAHFPAGHEEGWTGSRTCSSTSTPRSGRTTVATRPDPALRRSRMPTGSCARSMRSSRATARAAGSTLPAIRNGTHALASCLLLGDDGKGRMVDLEIGDGSLMVLVGPSGCGKTTLLRMVAGLEEITDGTIKIGDRVINDVDAKNRDLAMVFQNYALCPHMTSYGTWRSGSSCGSRLARRSTAGCARRRRRWDSRTS
jgi:predicted dehydrogenase